MLLHVQLCTGNLSGSLVLVNHLSWVISPLAKSRERGTRESPRILSDMSTIHLILLGILHESCLMSSHLQGNMQEWQKLKHVNSAQFNVLSGWHTLYLLKSFRQMDSSCDLQVTRFPADWQAWSSAKWPIWKQTESVCLPVTSWKADVTAQSLIPGHKLKYKFCQSQSQAGSHGVGWKLKGVVWANSKVAQDAWERPRLHERLSLLVTWWRKVLAGRGSVTLQEPSPQEFRSILPPPRPSLQQCHTLFLSLLFWKSSENTD